MRVVAITALAMLAGCETAGPGTPVTDADYMSVIEAAGKNLASDMTRSHECFVVSVIGSSMVMPSSPPDVNAANQELHRYQADAYNFRIRDLMASGQAIPVEFAWVAQGFATGQESEGGVKFRQSLQTGGRAAALDKECQDAFASAAGASFKRLTARAGARAQGRL